MARQRRLPFDGFRVRDCRFLSAWLRPVIEQLEARRLLSGWLSTPANGPSWNNGSGIGQLELLSDGSVLAAIGTVAGGGVTSHWARLSPDATGNYANGAWQTVPDMSLGRRFFTSDILNNGDLYVLGAEYNTGGVYTATAELFNPFNQANPWSSQPAPPLPLTRNAPPNNQPPPFPVQQYGDGPSQMLPDGRILCGYIFTGACYIYDPSTQTWSTSPQYNKLHGDINAEESWLKLSDGSILSVDLFGSTGAHKFLAQRFDPNLMRWVDASGIDTSNPPQIITDPANHEVGPAFQLPNGDALFTGANTLTGYTAIYHHATGLWSAGPLMQVDGTLLSADDNPGSSMPNGDFLFSAFNSTTHQIYVLEYNPFSNSFTNVSPTNFNFLHTAIYMLELPSGQVMFSSDTSNTFDLYTPPGVYADSWAPQITDITQNSSGNGAVTITGTQLNGIGQGAMWGDDSQAYSNFPLLQILNAPDQFYIPTFNWRSTGVNEGSTPESVQANLGQGFDLMRVIGGGIPSPTVFNIQMSPSINDVTLRRDGNFLDLFISGALADAVAFSNFSKVIVTGSSGSDGTVTIDYSGGFFSTPVVVDGPIGLIHGNTNLIIEDRGDQNGQTWNIGAGNVNSPAGANVNYYVASLYLALGDGFNNVNVTGDSAPTTIDGDNKVGNTGNTGDAIVVGSIAPTLGGTLSGITQPLSIVNTSNGSTLAVDDGGDLTDNQIGTVTPSQITGFGMGGSISYIGSQFAGLTVTAGQGKNLVDITGTSTPTQVKNLSTQPSETVGSLAPSLGGVLSGIQAPLTLTNPSGPANVFVDDSGDANGTTGDITGSQITGLGMGSAGVIHYAAGELAVLAGTGPNTIAVDGTSVPTAVTASHKGAVEFSNVYVHAISQSLTINDAGGPVNTYISSTAPGISGTLANIRGAVTVNNTSNQSTLTVDDSGDTQATSGTIGAASITGLGLPGTSIIFYRGAQLKSLEYEGGAGRNLISVAQTSTQTTIIASQNSGEVDVRGASSPLKITAADALNIGSAAPSLGGTLTQIRAPITLVNGSTQAAVTLDDSGDQRRRAGTINGGTITGFGMNAAASLTTQGAADASLAIHTRAATASVTSTNTATTLIGAAGQNNVLVGPSADTVWDISGAGAGSIPAANLNFQNYQSLHGGAGNDTFIMQNGASIPGSIIGGTGVNTLDYSGGWTGNVVVNLKLPKASGVTGGVFNITRVIGASGGPPGAYNILVGNGHDVLTGGDGRPNLLETGNAAGTLQGGTASDILIGGTTSYDSQADAHDLISIMAYWASTSDPYATRVNDLLGGIGVPALNPSAVKHNPGADTLLGHHGSTTDLNLYFGTSPIKDTNDASALAGERFINV